ncbi:MAG: hypothetical protein QME72_08575 [Rhodococcus sp. (in: high G+C Gram-positive bacteria)]|nr:hypothetical protein [Rhodococcus sp. (in: high G+C Gram-positive bacteria)]MDI6627759.1 hypothetical protein [Rhodococcus sp. (in: high G+C Gram-positive bacteria)]
MCPADELVGEGAVATDRDVDVVRNPRSARQRGVGVRTRYLAIGSGVHLVDHRAEHHCELWDVITPE